MIRLNADRAHISKSKPKAMLDVIEAFSIDGNGDGGQPIMWVDAHHYERREDDGLLHLTELQVVCNEVRIDFHIHWGNKYPDDESRGSLMYAAQERLQNAMTALVYTTGHALKS